MICSIEEIRDTFTTEDPDNDITIFDALYVQGRVVVQEEEILDAQWFTVSDALNLELAFNIREYISRL